MGKRGPKPTPTAILKNRGSWLVNDRADADDCGLRDLPDPPSWLQPEARAHWSTIGQWLVGWGVMLDRYSPSLAVLCTTCAHFIRLEKAVATEPLSVESSGGPKTNPIWTEYDRAYKRLMDALTRHGLTPSAAAGIGPQKEKPKPSMLAGLKLA